MSYKAMSWNEVMRAIRKEFGETQRELAKNLGWSRPQIQRYEKGEPPTIEYLIAFCNHYKVDPNRILFDELREEREHGNQKHTEVRPHDAQDLQGH